MFILWKPERDDHCRRHIWHVPPKTINGFRVGLGVQVRAVPTWLLGFSQQNMFVMISHDDFILFVMGKPEILHSSQLRKAFRPRSQSVETQTLVAYGDVRQVKKCHFLVVLICFTTCGNWSSWQEMAGGSIARLSNIADIHRLIPDVLQLAGQRHKEMLVSRGICRCKHHGNSRNIAHVIM